MYHVTTHVVNQVAYRRALLGYRAVSDQVDQHPEGEREKREGNSADQRIRAQLHSRLPANAEKGDSSKNRLPRLLPSKGKDEDGRPCHRRRPRKAPRYRAYIYKKLFFALFELGHHIN